MERKRVVCMYIYILYISKCVFKSPLLNDLTLFGEKKKDCISYVMFGLYIKIKKIIITDRKMKEKKIEKALYILIRRGELEKK